MITMANAQTQSAPAEVEDSTRATLRSASGDSYPLPATYEGRAALVNAPTARAVIYVATDTGHPITHLLDVERAAPPISSRAGSDDLQRVRVLAYDEAVSDEQNGQHAYDAVLRCASEGTAKSIPLIVAMQLAREFKILQFQLQLYKDRDVRSDKAREEFLAGLRDRATASSPI